MTRQTMSTHRSPPMAVESLFNPAGSEGVSTSSRHSVATSDWSRRAGFRRGSRQTETGLPMAWPIKAAARSMSRRPPAAQRRLWLQVSTGHSPLSGRRTGDTCFSGVSASAALQQRATSIGTWRRFQAEPQRPWMRARSCCKRDFRLFRDCHFPMLGSAAGTASSFTARWATPRTYGRSEFHLRVGSAERRSARRSARRTKHPPR